MMYKNPFGIGYIILTITIYCKSLLLKIHTGTHNFNSHFLAKPQLASSCLELLSPLVLNVCIFSGQTKTLHMLFDVILTSLPQSLPVSNSFCLCCCTVSDPITAIFTFHTVSNPNNSLRSAFLLHAVNCIRFCF